MTSSTNVFLEIRRATSKTSNTNHAIFQFRHSLSGLKVSEIFTLEIALENRETSFTNVYSKENLHFYRVDFLFAFNLIIYTKL